MTEAEADALARERNEELGAGGRSTTFWVPVETDDGWDVELKRDPPRSRRSKVAGFFIDLIGF